jgi:hypothetical protein
MENASQDERPRPKPRLKAMVLGFIAAIATAVAVSRSTPDGNLVVTPVPALVVGLAVFGLAFKRFHR